MMSPSIFTAAMPLQRMPDLIRNFAPAVEPSLLHMAATPVSLPTVGTWSGPGTITSPNSATTTVTGLPIGTHNFTWTVNNGPCGSTSDVVQIRIYGPGQTAASASASAVEVCSNAPTVTLTGNSLVNPASGTWTIIQGGGVLSAPNSQVSTISNMPVGTTCIEWRIYNGPCATPLILADTVCINVFDIAQSQRQCRSRHQ
jgi:hypothetical protein